jgi:thioredoxin 1
LLNFNRNHNVLMTLLRESQRRRNITFWEVINTKEDEELDKIKEKKMAEMKKSYQKQGVVKLTSSSFEDFLKTDMPVLVDFWADWCMPCRMMAPVMEQLAEEFAGKALFGKVNVDENPDVASRFGIMSIPHFLVFKNGTLAEKVVGAVGRDPLANTIKKYL